MRLLSNYVVVGIAVLLLSVLLSGQSTPSAPSRLMADSHQKHQARLRWDAPSGPGADQPIGYIIYRTNCWTKNRVVNCGKNWQQIATTAANVTEYTDRKVKPGNAYCYSVAANTSRGKSSKSFAVPAEIPSP